MDGDAKVTLYSSSIRAGLRTRSQPATTVNKSGGRCGCWQRANGVRTCPYLYVPCIAYCCIFCIGCALHVIVTKRFAVGSN